MSTWAWGWASRSTPPRPCCRRVRAFFRARWCDLRTCARVWLRVYVFALLSAVCFVRCTVCSLACAYVCLTRTAQEGGILDASPNKTLPNADCPATIGREFSRLASPICLRCFRSRCRAARHYSPTKVWHPEISANRCSLTIAKANYTHPWSSGYDVSPTR